MKAFLSEQCKEIEENNRMGKSRDLFKKVRDTKVLVLYQTGTWWSGVDNERVKEGKRLRRKETNIPWVTQLAFVLHGISQKQRERKKERETDTGTQPLMEQRCFNQHGVGIYTVLQGSYSQQR